LFGGWGNGNGNGMGGGLQPCDDGSYRGRGRGARRDSMGRYSSSGYSRADEIEKSHDRMVERLKQIMSNTPDERTRRSLDELASEMSGM